MTFSHQLKLLLLLLGCVILPRPAVGHDGWMEISPAVVETNQSTTIALLQGNHSNEHNITDGVLHFIIAAPAKG